MISRIQGKLKDKKDNSVLVEVNGISYEVLVPGAIMKRIDKNVDQDGIVDLITFHYHQVDPARSIPILVGFLNEVEKEFFEQFITVSGVGPKAAVRALNLPISTIAQAIDEGNAAVLKSLPGIGEQRAREIIAKLQGKVGKFGLIQDYVPPQPALKEDFQAEAMEVLLQLQYTKSEAKEMLQKAMERNSQIATSEELLNEVYKQRTGVKCNTD